ARRGTSTGRGTSGGHVAFVPTGSSGSLKTSTARSQTSDARRKARREELVSDDRRSSAGFAGATDPGVMPGKGSCDSIYAFDRRLCRRNLALGEVSEGAVEAPSDFPGGRFRKGGEARLRVA